MITQEDIGKRIAAVRKAKSFSQDELAKMLDMTRPSLAQIELGNRNISAGELLKLSAAFEISLDKLLGENFELDDIDHVDAKKDSPAEERISVPKLKTGKFMQVLLYVIQRCAGKPNIGETVLNKLMYFIEFNFYERYEEHMIGATFTKLQFGPVPQNMDSILKKMEDDGQIKMIKTNYKGYPQKRFIPLAEADLSQLNMAEIEVIDQVLSQMSDFSARGISDYSHKDIPWKATKDGEVIDYELAFYREAPFSARAYYSNEPENEI